MEKRIALHKLSEEIALCRACSTKGINVRHGNIRFRGYGDRRVMAVGVSPGNSELKGAQAFSGAAGNRLMTWLQQAGLGDSREEILNNTYLTSISKCGCKDTDIGRVSTNCFPFLKRQIELVAPSVFITLGNIPFSTLFNKFLSLDEIVGHSFYESDLNPTLYPLLPENSLVVPLPHPSPLSRWLNDEQNKDKLADALSLIKKKNDEI